MAHERYHSYLLRFRQDHEGAPWRVDLEDVHSGQRHAFPSAEGAFAYLRRLLDAGDAVASPGLWAGRAPEADES